MHYVERLAAALSSAYCLPIVPSSYQPKVSPVHQEQNHSWLKTIDLYSEYQCLLKLSGTL